MLWWTLYGLATVVVCRMAAFEQRSPVPWAVVSLAVGLGLAELHALLALAGPLVVFVVGFVGLFVAKARDERGRGDRRIR